MTVAVAVSGGADSLYALASLCRAATNPRREVFALHALFRDVPPEQNPVPALAAACRELGVTLHTADLRHPFAERIIRPFIKSYIAGQTPNPCAHCNAVMKFGLLLDAARQLGAETIATGHYARRAHHPRYGAALRQGEDDTKDQSYFLALTPADRLQRAVFPLGGLRKQIIRNSLSQWGIAVPLPRESQEICFIPNNDYRTFIQNSGTPLPPGGPMVLEDGLVVGRHNGLWQYTEGQRRGLGVAWAEPLYVIGKDKTRNALLLGPAADLPVSGCVADRMNFLIPPALWPNELRVRVRYHQKATPADVHLVGGGPTGMDATARMLVRFHTPGLPCAPGQLVAVSDTRGFVLAGGIIRGDR